MLREFYPAALQAFDDLSGRDALAVPATAPTPEAGRALRVETIAELLRHAGRQRYLHKTATRIYAALQVQHLAATPLLAKAHGATTRAHVSIITTLAIEIDALQGEVDAHFGQHPNSEIHRSQPGLGVVLAARVLAEFGDDPDRYATGKARRNYAGTSPITRASGAKTAVLARHARNRRLGDALFHQAFAALTNSPGARAHHDAMRARGIGHNDALRRLANRLVSILHGCLRHHTLYDEATAWTTRQDQQKPLDNLQPWDV